MQNTMKIAIIGGGKRCRAFLEMFDAKRFPKLRAEIVAVADPNPEAVGIQLAREMHIFTTQNYKDFFAIRPLDLVVELTGREELLDDFLRNKPPKMRVLEGAISRIFGDVLRLREEYLFTIRQVDLVEGIINSLFLSIRDWVLVLQPDFKVLDANEAFVNAICVGKDKIIGKFCFQAAYGLTDPCGGEGFECPVKRSLETGEIAHAILERTGTDGATRCHEITAVPLKAADGRLQLVVEYFRDITDELERKVEQKVLALKLDLMRLVHEEKMISLGKLAASAVHEINNPLSGIYSLARLMQQELQSDNIDEASKERFIYYLDLIGTESARCSTIVGDLLQFSRQSNSVKVPLQLNDIVERAIHFIGYQLGSQNIKVRTRLSEDLPLMTGDQSQIQQCLLNLLLNAADAMPTGGELFVSTSVDSFQEQIRLEIADNGTGIPEEFLSRVFEPFFSSKGRDKGIGLGLSVVYGIVKGHGGSISVQSEEGAGARFLIEFPLEAGPQQEKTL